jgi:hypothetical protein
VHDVAERRGANDEDCAHGDYKDERRAARAETP